jgi:hypothetical protein
MLRRVIVAIGVAAWLLTVAASGDAVARVWSAPRVLAANVGPALPMSAVQAAGGQTVAAWAGSTGVFAAVARGDGGFGVAVRLSPASISNDGAQLLAMDRRGDAIVVWQHENSGNPSPGSLFISYRPSGGEFGRVVRVARDMGTAAVALDARGDATIAWDQFRRDSGSEAIDVVGRRADGRYGRVQQVALGGLAVNTRGQALLVWQSGGLTSAVLLAATRPARGTFGPAVQLVSGRNGTEAPQVGLSNTGTARVVWEGPFDGAGTGTLFSHIEAMSLRVGARIPGAVQSVPTPRLGQLGDGGPLLKVDPRGDAIVVWQNTRSRPLKL